MAKPICCIIMQLHDEIQRISLQKSLERSTISKEYHCIILPGTKTTMKVFYEKDMEEVSFKALKEWIKKINK
jgi:hypothetical protein